MDNVAKKPQTDKTKSLLEEKAKYVAGGISALAPIFIDKAKGAIIQDIDGNEYIDFYGGIGVINAGHCPDSVVDAIKEQADKLLHSCFMVGMYEPYIQLAKKTLSNYSWRFTTKRQCSSIVVPKRLKMPLKLPKPTPNDRVSSPLKVVFMGAPC